MTRRDLWRKILSLLGPAFVAAVAYVDPGNFATNFSAGAKYGYLLLWVLVVSNLMAALVQYLSAKVGLITGQSLPELVAAKLPRWARLIYWAQAQLVAVACDIAEVVGGALALNLLFGTPLVAGGVIIGLASLLLLRLYTRREQKYFERAIILLLFLIPIGFFVGLWQHPPQAHALLAGLVPRFAGSDTVLLASAMLGATIMPHVIYLHSALARDRHGHVAKEKITSYLRATKIDVILAMAIAGTVNVAMLVLAATALQHQGPMETFAEIYQGLGVWLGPLVAILFAIGLLISGLASTSVGNQAGAAIIEGLLSRKFSVFTQRVATMVPSLFLLALGFEPTNLLIISQIALSLGIPFALIPLALAATNKRLMGEFRSRGLQRIALYATTVVVICLNIALIVMTFLH